MTQIQDTFEGCGEAPAPLKLNEVFISRADSTLNAARSRAVTVNVSLQSIRCLFSPANGPERTKGRAFSCYFPCFPLARSPPPHTWSSLVCFFLSLTLVLLPAAQMPHHRAPLPVSPASESLYIVVSSWIWKPRSEVNVREVWQQQSTPMEGRIKNSETCVSVERGTLDSAYWHCLWLGRSLSDGGGGGAPKAAFEALIALHSEIPLKGFPSL